LELPVVAAFKPVSVYTRTVRSTHALEIEQKYNGLFKGQVEPQRWP
jgi:hypothetical protein